MTTTLLITPPLTQLNTPYPGTAYLARYLRPKGFKIAQVDLGIELINSIFSKSFLSKTFDKIDNFDQELSEASSIIFNQRKRYIRTVESVISFLQGNQQTLANRIVKRGYLPEGNRFTVIDSLPSDTFGNMSIADIAKFYATLYLEDLALFINETTSKHFECTRYAEKISISLASFSTLETQLESAQDDVTSEILNLLKIQALPTSDRAGR